MSAGGSIEDNINRWYGQFEQADGKSTKDKSKTEKFDVAGNTVHWVDIPGNFKETMGGGGPFSVVKLYCEKTTACSVQLLLPRTRRTLLK